MEVVEEGGVGVPEIRFCIVIIKCKRGESRQEGWTLVTLPDNGFIEDSGVDGVEFCQAGEVLVSLRSTADETEARLPADLQISQSSVHDPTRMNQPKCLWLE